MVTFNLVKRQTFIWIYEANCFNLKIFNKVFIQRTNYFSKKKINERSNEKFNFAKNLNISVKRNYVKRIHNKKKLHQTKCFLGSWCFFMQRNKKSTFFFSITSNILYRQHRRILQSTRIYSAIIIIITTKKKWESMMMATLCDNKCTISHHELTPNEIRSELPLFLSLSGAQMRMCATWAVQSFVYARNKQPVKQVCDLMIYVKENEVCRCFNRR